MKQSIQTLLSGLLFAIILLSSCRNNAEPDKSAGEKFHIPDSLLPSLTFDTVHYVPLESELNFSGKITYNEDNVVKIYPMAGGHVSEVKVSVGDYVAKGGILAKIRSSDMVNYMNDFKSSKSELEIARKNLQVASEMRSSGITSERDLLIAREEYEKAFSKCNSAREVIKIMDSSASGADSSGSTYLVRAPISGFIVSKTISEGMNLRPDAGQDLFTISDLKKLWAVANVYETDIDKILPGSQSRVTTLSYSDKEFPGRVDRISNVIDPDTKLMTIKIGLENPGYLLKPGMFARIAIQVPEAKRVLAVPTSSIIFDDNKTFIVQFRSKDDVSIREIKVLKSINKTSFIECNSITAGDVVLTRFALFIYTALKNI